MRPWRWSRSKLAEALGVSESVLWRWETVQRHPTCKHVARIRARLEGDTSTAPSTINRQLRHHRWRLELHANWNGQATWGYPIDVVSLGVRRERTYRSVLGEAREAVLGKKLEQRPSQGRPVVGERSGVDSELNLQRPRNAFSDLNRLGRILSEQRQPTSAPERYACASV